jgi:hypothetical protein
MPKPYNQPLPYLGNIQDDWCSTAQSVCGYCGAPSVIDNQNLEKSTGGTPGFFAVSKHMCVSDTPCSVIPRKNIDPSTSGSSLPGDVSYCQKPVNSEGEYLFWDIPASGCPAGSDCGCNQFKDSNRKIFGSTILLGPTNIDYKVSKSSSHIIKLVDHNYWRRDCIKNQYSQPPAPLGNGNAKQNYILYVDNCSENIGNNDRGMSQGIRAYAKNCNSYAMNLNPEANRASNIHKCCVPKRSGPFLLETNYKNTLFREMQRTSPNPPQEPILEKIYDAPITISLFGEIPDYTLLNENILYILQNKIHCDCDEDGCFEYIPVSDFGVVTTGACCKDGGCSLSTQEECTTLGGNYHGNGSSCSTILCSPGEEEDTTPGACIGTDGQCSPTTQANCTANGGNYKGNGSICPNPDDGSDDGSGTDPDTDPDFSGGSGCGCYGLPFGMSCKEAGASMAVPLACPGPCAAEGFTCCC